MREERRREQAALEEKLAQRRKQAELDLQKLRERTAKAREEAKKAAEEEAKAVKQGNAPKDYIREHIARAKEKARELQVLIDEENQRTQELEAIKLRHVEAPMPKVRFIRK